MRIFDGFSRFGLLVHVYIFSHNPYLYLLVSIGLIVLLMDDGVYFCLKPMFWFLTHAYLSRTFWWYLLIFSIVVPLQQIKFFFRFQSCSLRLLDPPLQSFSQLEFSTSTGFILCHSRHCYGIFLNFNSKSFFIFFFLLGRNFFGGFSTFHLLYKSIMYLGTLATQVSRNHFCLLPMFCLRGGVSVPRELLSSCRLIIIFPCWYAYLLGR